MPPVKDAIVTVESHGLGVLSSVGQGANFGAVPIGGADVVQFGIHVAERVGDAIHLTFLVDCKSDPVVATRQHCVDWRTGTVFHVDSVQDAITQTVHGLRGDVIGQLSHRVSVAKNGDLVCLRVNQTESAI